MDPDRYAASQAASLNDDWQYSRIFAAPAARPGFTALLALRAEMRQLQASTQEPGIAAMKFEWWREEIARGFSGDAQHPVARALGRHLGAAGSAAEYCQELVDAAETEYDMAPPNVQSFQLYLYRSSGVLAEQLVLLHGITERAALAAARKLGQAKRFLELIIALHPMIQSGRWLFPHDWLGDADPQTLLAGDAAARRTLDALLEALDRERVDARTAMEQAALPPALALQWPLLQRDYKRLGRMPPERLLRAEPRDGMLRRLWVAWRGARHSVKRET